MTDDTSFDTATRIIAGDDGTTYDGVAIALHWATAFLEQGTERSNVHNHRSGTPSPSQGNRDAVVGGAVIAGDDAVAR